MEKTVMNLEALRLATQLHLHIGDEDPKTLLNTAKSYVDFMEDPAGTKAAGELEEEELALLLHEAGRAAVEAGNTVAAEKFGEQTRKFLEWEELTEPAREGRRIQARYILKHFRIIGRVK